MKKKTPLFLLLIIVLISLSTFTLAQKDKVYHLKLLAVQETGNGHQGSDADIYLEIKEGSGRVFLDTFPVTRMDTQISTRFAKEIACKHFSLNCNEYDFIYTIESKSNIIGGPSAGAAIAALTTIGMLDLDYDDEITITGTINSGGIIGSVGGVKEKLEAASKAGLKKVLISKGTAAQLSYPAENISSEDENINSNDTKINDTNEIDTINSIQDIINTNGTNSSNDTSSTNTPSNITSIIENNGFNLLNYSKDNLSLEVVEVIDLDEVIFHLTGKDLNHKIINITENKQYTEIMNGLQNLLCSRMNAISNELKRDGFKLDENESISVNNKKEKSENSSRDGDYYSSASFCFGANIELKNYYYQKKKISKNMVEKLFETLSNKAESIENKLDNEKIETISDLQTFMVVKERINDVKEQINKFNESLELSQNELYSLLAYTEERLFSAITWMQFFEMDGKKFVMDDNILRKSCQQKISESEQMLQYASIYLGEFYLQGIGNRNQLAKKAMENNEYALCLILASQSKGESNAVLSTLGLPAEALDDFIESKQKAVQGVINKNSAKDIFPILGYSYYQYSQSLAKDQKYTSLIYLEYALEMSELSIYFPEDIAYVENFDKFEIKKEWWYLIAGFIAGIFVMGLLGWRKKK